MTDNPPNRTPAIIGFLIAGAVILGASFLVSTLGDGPDDDVPPLTILRPASGDSVTNPVTITFRTPGRLRLDPAMGWSAGELHLHVMAGGQELMPAAADIEPVATDVEQADADIAPSEAAYIWHLPALPAGTRKLYLTWAGRHHGNLRGQTDTIVVHVRGGD
jgi:hypothetical protein